MKNWFLIPLLIFPFDAFSCRIPFSGLAMDNQIEVEYLSENGSFSIRLPAKLFPTSPKDANVYLIFKTVDGEKQDYSLTKEVNLDYENGYLVGNLHITPTTGYVTLIEAVWWPPIGEICQTVGTKILRMLPDQ